MPSATPPGSDTEDDVRTVDRAAARVVVIGARPTVIDSAVAGRDRTSADQAPDHISAA